ncbi:hypothetical protein [Actinacidiphila acidipaludis]|uniref:Phosphatidate cytidylyltransferase n=1 Tax=Actinacidiphila acidipaludis TaxID=2873382 RepID=A0ABS7Q982_9ACTN|nr:hypothetical protein [Streptomyces acidipaludis]MBY8878339.1 hypothetical protein [Streptomyces acidipaludis]
MPGAAKTMAVTTATTLVLVVAYTVALGAGGWLWFGWVVLLLCTAGVAVIRLPTELRPWPAPGLFLACSWPVPGHLADTGGELLGRPRHAPAGCRGVPGPHPVHRRARRGPW